MSRDESICYGATPRVVLLKGKKKKKNGDSPEMDRSSDVRDRKLIYGTSLRRLRTTKPPCSYYLRGRSGETVQELDDRSLWTGRGEGLALTVGMMSLHLELCWSDQLTGAGPACGSCLWPMVVTATVLPHVHQGEKVKVGRILRASAAFCDLIIRRQACASLCVCCLCSVNSLCVWIVHPVW